LSGEAFFQVDKGRNKRRNLGFNWLSVEVYGTSFNVNTKKG
jgi:ferric-dicitrate binding protein FerR (iron transport regulator)